MKKHLLLALEMMLTLAISAQEVEDVTYLIANPGFDEDLTFQVNGAMKEIISTDNSLSDRSWVYVAVDSSVYAKPKTTSGQSRPDGRKLEATNGFIGRIQGWTVETNQTFPKCEWVYFGSIPYDLQSKVIPIADDGSTYLEVPQRPEAVEGDNVGFVYFRAGWGGRATYKQEINLPCARYILTYWAINLNPNATKGTNLSKVTCRKDVFKDETGFNDTQWTQHTIEFTSTDDVTIEFGFESNGGSGSNPFLCIDNIQLYRIKPYSYIDGIYYFFNEENSTAMVVNGEISYSGSVTIPASIKYEGKSYTVTAIGENAFKNCIGLTSIDIPSSIQTISNYAFDSCYNLAKVTVAWTTPISINSTVFPNSGNATLHVPSGSESAYASADYWKDFKTIVEPPILFADDAVKALCVAYWDTNKDGVLSKNEAATITDLGSVFKNNTDITTFDELQYFTGLTSIGDSAFYYCSNLASITIPDNVTTIEHHAFYYCEGLTTLHVSANITSIEDRAFAYCSGLESIVVDNGNTVYDSRDNCNALIETNTNTLLVGCKNTVIPSGVKVIADGAFRGCTELTNIEIPEGVTTIGTGAFRGCNGLESVTLPSTITMIGTYAFSAYNQVYNLTSVTVGMTTPVAITSEVFPNRANSTLYVPKGSRAAYKAANYWKEFKKIIELDNGVPVKCEKPVITILANGKVKVESATEGATCITTITASNAEPLTDGEISLTTPLVVYTVSSYATAEDYEDSDVATSTFRWEKSEGDINGDGMVNISDVVKLVNMILGL